MKFAQGLERWIKRQLPPSWRDRLRSSKFLMIMRKNAPIDLIIHLGAHYAEDINLYESFGAKTVLWVEGDPDTFKILQEKLAAHKSTQTSHLAVCALVSSEDDKSMSFYRFNEGGDSSSVHRSTETFRKRFGNVRETGEVLKLKSATLTSILKSQNLEVSTAQNPMLVIDVQGHEMDVLKGAGNLIEGFRFCKCEVSRIETYESGSRFKDVDAYFRKNGFHLVSHRYFRVPKHGDVLYQKS